MKRYRELLENALIALKSTYDYNDYPGGYNCSQGPVIKEIKEELAKPEIDPVAWLYGGKLSDGADDFHLTFNEPERGYKVPLYTSPPQQDPLSEEEILKIWRDAQDQSITIHPALFVANAIEKYHGIG